MQQTTELTLEQELALVPADSRNMYWRCKGCGHIGGGLFNLNCHYCGRTRSHPSIQHDWTCPRCEVEIFASKDRCKKCNARQGDWKCACGFINFASRHTCKTCNTSKSCPSSRWHSFIVMYENVSVFHKMCIHDKQKVNKLKVENLLFPNTRAPCFDTCRVGKF